LYVVVVATTTWITRDKIRALVFVPGRVDCDPANVTELSALLTMTCGTVKVVLVE
jgi:hypothetical protein